MSRTARILRRERLEITLLTLIDLFVTTKLTEGRSERTVTWYRGLLTQFAEFVGNGQPARLGEVTVDDARRFVAALQQRSTKYDCHPLRPQEQSPLSPHTIHGYVRALKAFSSWLCEEGFTPRPVFARLKRPKLPKTLIKILSDQEIASIVACINPRCFLGARMYVMTLLLLDTGIRASELCGLTIDNTFVKQDYIKVTGKGRKERMVPFGAATRKALMRYITTWRPAPAHPDITELVLSVRGGRLTCYGLFHAIKRLGRRAGVPRLHPHLFRHTFSVHYLMNGGDVMTLKLILGHTTLEVTQMYMHLAEAHVKIQHNRFSPVDRLELGGRRRNHK